MMGHKICFYGEIYQMVLMMGHKICFYGEIWLIIEDNPKIISFISQPKHML